MSTPPFPPANQPPYSPGPGQPPGYGQPPGFGQPGGFAPGAPPPWQGGGGIPTGQTASPVSSGKSKKPLIIGAIVVAILIGVGVLVFAGGDDEGDGSSKVDAAGAASGLKVLLRDGSFDDDGTEQLNDCPLGNVDDLTAAVGKVVDLEDDVSDGDDESALFEETDFPGFVDCQINADDDVPNGPSGLYFQVILDPPRDYEGYINEYYGGESTDITFEDSIEYLDGEIFIYCAEERDENGFTGCDADWVNDDENIAINLFLNGQGQDPDDAVAGLKAILPTIAANLAELAEVETES